jgi:hypothetical protein
MIYSELGNNTQGLEYKDDPLAKTIAPDYNKLSMSAWGIPQLDEMDKFAPKMDENLDTVPDEYSQYLNNFQDLTSTAQKFMKLGFDITKPSLDPRENAAHMEWLQKFNSNTELGKKLQQSRKIREAIQSAGTKDVYTNPVTSDILTSTDPFVNRPDLDRLKGLVESRSKSRDLAYTMKDLEGANAEIAQTLDAIDGWEAQNIANNPAFEAQYKRDADLARAQIKGARYDQKSNDIMDLKRKAQAETSAYHRGILNLARNKFGWQQSQSAPIEFDTESLIRQAGTGDVQAIDLINRYYGTNPKGESTNASLKVIKGSALKGGIDVPYGDETKNVKATVLRQPNGSTITVDDNTNYFVRVDENGNKYVTPVNETSIRSYTQGVIGKTTEAGTSKNKTSNLWSGDEVEITDTPINAKKTNTQSGNSSTTNVSRNTTITTQPKKKITW